MGLLISTIILLVLVRDSYCYLALFREKAEFYARKICLIIMPLEVLMDLY